jgi:hypothetical protein
LNNSAILGVHFIRLLLEEVQMFRRPSPSIVISLLALFIALGGAGYSATGGNFILGRANSASSQTTLLAPFSGTSLVIRNTATFVGASALRLSVAAGHQPLIVTTRTKVANLNVDLLDGLDSAAFARSAQEGWHYIGSPGEPGFENGWSNKDSNFISNSQNAAFRMDNNGIIHIRGSVAGGTVTLAIFHLPARYCPYFNHSFPVPLAGGGLSTVSVIAYHFPEGRIPCYVTLDSGSNFYVALEGVDYPNSQIEQSVAASASLR